MLLYIFIRLVRHRVFRAVVVEERTIKVFRTSVKAIKETIIKASVKIISRTVIKASTKIISRTVTGAIRKEISTSISITVSASVAIVLVNRVIKVNSFFLFFSSVA